MAPDTTDNEYSSGSGSLYDTAKYSSAGSAGKVSITGKDKVHYIVSSPEDGSALSETNESGVVTPFLKNENQTVAFPSPSRKSPSSYIRTHDEERPLEDHREASTTQLTTPPSQRILDSSIASHGIYPQYNPDFERSINANDPNVVEKISPGHDYSNPNGVWAQRQNYIDEGIQPPDYVPIYQERPMQDHPRHRSPNPETSPERAYLPFPDPLPYPHPQGPLGHRLRTPSPGSAPHAYLEAPWNGRLFPNAIPEHGGMENPRWNLSDNPENDRMMVHNPNPPNYSAGTSSGLELPSSGPMWSSGGASSPLSFQFMNQGSSDMRPSSKSPLPSRFSDQFLGYGNFRPIVQSG